MMNTRQYKPYDKIKFIDWGADSANCLLSCQVKRDVGNGKLIVYHPSNFDKDGELPPGITLDNLETLEIDIIEDKVQRNVKCKN